MRLTVILLAVLCLAGCVHRVSGNQLYYVSRHGSMYTKSLHYCGTDSDYHYFRQLVEPFALIGSGKKAYRVPVKECRVPEAFRFPYVPFRRSPCLKVRIKEGGKGSVPYVKLRDRDSHATERVLAEIKELKASGRITARQK